MKKALLAVAVLAASSSAFAATENQVLIAGKVFGETCVIEDATPSLGLPAISQSQVKDNTLKLMVCNLQPNLILPWVNVQ